MFVEELKINEEGRQQLTIGTPMYPCMCYDQYMDQLAVGEVSWHWQPELEFFIVREGRAQAEGEGFRTELKEGEGLFINGNTLHRVRSLGKERCRYYSILFWPEFLYGTPGSIVEQKYVRPMLECGALDLVKLSPEVPWMRKILHYVRRACETFMEEGYGHEILVRENFSRAWYYFAKNTREAVLQQRAMKDAGGERLKAMLKYIYLHYGEPLNVAGIAGAAGISESECYRCFKKKLGISPAEFLVSHRIRTAAGMLREKDRSITEICYSVGFNNPSYFTKCFREIIGYSPREFRKLLKEEEREELRHDI